MLGAAGIGAKRGWENKEGGGDVEWVVGNGCWWESALAITRPRHC